MSLAIPEEVALPAEVPALETPASEPAEPKAARVPARKSATKVPPPRALKIERTFAFVVAVVPFVGLLAALAWHVMSAVDLVLMVILYAWTGFGITAGFHRLFTHRSFECTPRVRSAFAIAGSMALQGPVIRWVGDHRRHHQFSDKDGDPHSPHLMNQHGFVGAVKELWHAHIGWFFDQEKTRTQKFAPDLISDKQVVAIDKRYMTWVYLSVGLPFVLGGLLTWSWKGALTALLWAGFARIFFVHHVTWSINSICHFFGKKPYETGDESTNNVWLAIPSLGESWHNAHHAFPTSAVHGLGKWQVDLSATLIKTLEKMGLAWNVKLPTEAQIAKRKLS
ncbi:MAG TPA: acyl-CoA desaturase [Polyangiaceae bacterium]